MLGDAEQDETRQDYTQNAESRKGGNATQDGMAEVLFTIYTNYP